MSANTALGGATKPRRPPRPPPPPQKTLELRTCAAPARVRMALKDRSSRRYQFCEQVRTGTMGRKHEKSCFGPAGRWQRLRWRPRHPRRDPPSAGSGRRRRASVACALFGICIGVCYSLRLKFEVAVSRIDARSLALLRCCARRCFCAPLSTAKPGKLTASSLARSLARFRAAAPPAASPPAPPPRAPPSCRAAGPRPASRPPSACPGP